MLNEHIFIETPRLRLVPYLSCFTEQYNKWMCNPTLLELTESEPLTLEEEKENQQSWLTSTDKLTFILLSPLEATSLGWERNSIGDSASSLLPVPPQLGMVSKKDWPPYLFPSLPQTAPSPSHLSGDNVPVKEKTMFVDAMLPPFSTTPVGAPNVISSPSPPPCVSSFPVLSPAVRSSFLLRYCVPSSLLYCGWCDGGMGNGMEIGFFFCCHCQRWREIQQHGKEGDVQNVVPLPKTDDTIRSSSHGSLSSSTATLSTATAPFSAASSGFVMIGDCNLFLLPCTEEDEEEEEEERQGKDRNIAEEDEMVVKSRSEEEGSLSSPLGEEDHHHRHCRRTFEVEVMIAEAAYRQQGLATEALRMLLWYAVRVLRASHFVAKILESNTASIQLFQKSKDSGGLGFKVLKQVPVFHEIHFGLTVGTTWRKQEQWLREWRKSWGRASLTTVSSVSRPFDASAPSSTSSLSLSPSMPFSQFESREENPWTKKESVREHDRNQDDVILRNATVAASGIKESNAHPLTCTGLEGHHPQVDATGVLSTLSHSTKLCRSSSCVNAQLWYGPYHKEQHESKCIFSLS